MASLDSVLNWLVPIIVILGIGAMLYTSKLKEPINQFFRWIGKTIMWVTGNAKEKVENATKNYEVTYTYG